MPELTLDDAYSEESDEQTGAVETEVKESTETVKATEGESPAETKTDDSTPESKWTFSQAMDERDKRQKAVARADKAEAELAKLRQDPLTSYFDDEEKADSQRSSITDQKLYDAGMEWSEAFAVEQHGQDLVDKAIAWVNAEAPESPSLVKQINKTKLVHNNAVKLYQKEKERLQSKDVDLNVLKEEWKAEVLEELKGSEKPDKPSVTPSLASQRSSGADTTASDDMSLESVWEGR